MHSVSSFADLPDIDAVSPLDAADQACFEEIRTVLKKHDRLNRFGVYLLHSHFHLEPDEMLLETCDSKSRELLIRAIPANSVLSESVKQTMWRLGDSQATQSCQMNCVAEGDTGKHPRKHVKYPG